MARLLLFAALLSGLWLAFGPEQAGPSGPATAVTLAALADDPGGWDGRRVRVTGRVVDRGTVMGLGGVMIADDSGNRLLAAGWTGPVTLGEKATVTGEYRVALAIGPLEVPVVLIDKGG